MQEIKIRKHPNARLGWDAERLHWKSGKRFLVGVDEAGRGPLAGPVVAAAVSFSYDCCEHFPKALYGLNDSKLVKPEDRDALFDAICTYSSSYGIGTVQPDVIDEVNILQATMRAMTLAVVGLTEMLLQKNPECCEEPEMLLVDGNYFRTTLSYPFQTLIGGDGISPHIAAASILAKVTRDRMMLDLHNSYPQYNFASHKGYATPEHRQALARFGPSPIHRKSFVLKSQDHSTSEALQEIVLTEESTEGVLA